MSLIRRYLEIFAPIWARRVRRPDGSDPVIKRELAQPPRLREMQLPGVRAAFKPKPKNIDYSSHS